MPAGCGSAGTRRSTGPRRACARWPSGTGPRRWRSPLTTPAGTAVSDGFPWINRLVRMFGSPNIVWGEEVCAWHRDFVTTYTFGADIGTPDFERTGCLLLWGHNPANTYLAQATAVAEAKARGAALVVVDPRRAGPAAGPISGCACGPARTARWRWGWPSVMIAEGWYDRDVHPRLVQRRAPGTRRHRPVSLRGRSRRRRCGQRTTWPGTRRAPAPVIYDPAAGRYTERVVDPLMLGGPSRCADARRSPSTAARVRDATPRSAATTRPSASSGSRACPPRRSSRPRGCSGSAARWRTSTGPGSSSTPTRARPCARMSLLYALTGCWDAPGGNVRPTRPAINDLAPLSLLSEAQRAQGAGPRRAAARARPARAGRRASTPTAPSCTARRTRCAGMVGFGANLLLSQPDAGVARAAAVTTGLSRLRRSLPHADGGAGRRGLAGVHGVGARGPARGLRSHARG